MNRIFWNERYKDSQYVYGVEPNHYLVEKSGFLAPGMKALSAGDGEGRNGVWLARAGLQVDTVDFSDVALEKARKLADKFGVKLNTIAADLQNWDWPENAYDVLVSIFVHFPPEFRKEIHRKMIAALKPGKFLIMQEFHKNQLKFNSGGPPREEMLYTAAMLRDDFQNTGILELTETETVLDEGAFHKGKASVINLFLKKQTEQ